MTESRSGTMLAPTGQIPHPDARWRLGSADRAPPGPHPRAASSTARTPETNTPSKVPPPPIEAT